MKNHTVPLGIMLAAILVLGAACQKKSTNTSNTNTSVITNTNTAATNTVTNADSSFNTGGDPDTNSNGQTATITITASGVDESELTVTAGTTVIFKNEDSVSHEMASDPHPAHTDLPALDRIIAPGAIYQFTFTTKGRWGYHDHLRGADRSLQGAVIVQ